MIYLLFGAQDLMIKDQSRRLIKERLGEADHFNLIKYDARQTLVQDIVSECQTMSLGVERKMIFVENAYFLSNAKSKEKIEKEQDYQKLSDYLNNPNQDADLVFTLNENKLNSRSNLFKLISEHGKIMELLDIKPYEWPQFIKNWFTKKGVSIEQRAINELVNRSSNNATLFVSEAQKLLLNNKHITYDDVIKLTTRPLEENSFLLADALLNGKIDEALSIFRDLKTYSQEPVSLINLLARQLRLNLKIMYLDEQGDSQMSIAKKLAIHEYRVKLALARRHLSSIEKLANSLEKLYELDWQIKSGAVDRFLGFELFLINFNN